MAALTINDLSVLTGLIVLPSFGAWHADITADGDEVLTGAVTLTDGVATFKGTVVPGQSGIFQGRAQARVIGGGGGFARGAAKLGAKAYRTTPLRTVLADILSAAGEVLSTDSTDAALGNFVPHWQRLAEPAGTCLTQVSDHISSIWRVKDDGSVFVGVDTFPTQEVTHEVIETNDVRGTQVIAAESFDLLPAVTFEGRQVSRVHHQIGEGARRTEVWFV